MIHLCRTAMKCTRRVEVGRLDRRMPLAFFDLPKHFSAEASDSGSAVSNEQLFQIPKPGVVYGRLTNISKYTNKRDVLNLLESGLRPENLKVEYNRSYFPTSMIVEFPSQSAYDDAVRTIGRKGRFLNMSRADKSQWDTITPHDGRAILLLGIPQNALIDDIERFLSGCQYDSTSTRLFVRPVDQGGVVRMAVVWCGSQAAAMHAYITKNRGFCLNNQISLQILH
ncbi:uncharacterized protein LOC127248456 [Andrographis paniculata]|uniref:uncharacterized protein LOC127248456 n=1 Tax=Andrographis paniculata TaxID=175694 RepID=UPI0021E84814|nr:uncharacterized protein LOC127248456 [Andrographis paniculata]